MFGIDDILSVGMKLVDKFVPDPQAKQEAQLKLLEMHKNGELAQLQADMMSDSWMSKNIRPMTLVFILVTYTTFGMMSAWDIEVNNNYVELLGQWGMLIMSFYFGGRTLEKIMDMKKNAK